MTGFVFGQDAPCRFCKGAGRRVVAMTPEQKRDHDRERRRQLKAFDHTGVEPERMPATKPCPDCDGRGYLPIAVVDRQRVG